MDTPVIGQVLIILVLMALGVLSYKLKISSKEAASFLSSFILKISLPCLILNSFYRPFNPELLKEAGIALGASVAIYCFALLLCWPYPYLLGLKDSRRGVHRYAIIISNSGFIGYPMVEAILGPQYLFHAVILNIPFNFLAFSLCAWIIAKEEGKAPDLSWRILLTPPLATTIIGLIMFVVSLPLPEPLVQSIRLVGNTTTPLSIIVIGISIAQKSLKEMLGSWRVYVTVAMRLIIMPLLAGIGCYLAGLRGPMLMLPVLITAMPVGTSASIIATYYNTAADEAGTLVALSTILCVVTVPLVVIAVHYFVG